LCTFQEINKTKKELTTRRNEYLSFFLSPGEFSETTSLSIFFSLCVSLCFVDILPLCLRRMKLNLENHFTRQIMSINLAYWADVKKPNKNLKPPDGDKKNKEEQNPSEKYKNYKLRKFADS